MRKNHYYTIIITAVAILGTSMLAGCADNKQVDTADTNPETALSSEAEDSSDKEEADVGQIDKKDWKGINGSESESISADIYDAASEEVFTAMSEWAYTFSSGAGGWSTELAIDPDGSFHGEFYDGDMGSTGPGYENGTVYICNFSGHLDKNVRMAGPLMYSLSIADIKYENEPGTEEIIDNVLYKYSTPYGLEGLEGKEDSLVFMDAGAVTSAINEEEMMWLSPTHFGSYVGEDWNYVEDTPDELPFAAIINTVDNYAFFSSNISDRNQTFLVNKCKLPGLKNTVSELNDDGTYRFADESIDGKFKVINACFEVSESYSLYNDAESFVNECLGKIYGNHGYNPEDVHVTSPDNAPATLYDKVALCGHQSGYAVFYPEGGDNLKGEGRFVLNESNSNGKNYAYAYIVETDNDYGLNGNNPPMPDSSFGSFYLSSLTLTGKSDDLSSAGEGKSAVKCINCYMKAPGKDSVMAKEVSPDENYREYKLAAGQYTPFYVQYPSDGFHKFMYTNGMAEYINRQGEGEENSALMYLYLNADNEVVYGYEKYTPRLSMNYGGNT